jgi:hypothetical protein
MNPNRFDEVTKALAIAGSRRQALKAIGVALGGALGLGRIGIAFAACHPPGHNCEENSTCCSQNCCIAAGQREGVCCDKGQTCQNGKCVTPCTANGGGCTQGSTCCSGSCSTHNFCCGPAGTHCTSATECCSGECVLVLDNQPVNQCR